MLEYLGCCFGVTAGVLEPTRCCWGGDGGRRDACTHSLQDGLGTKRPEKQGPLGPSNSATHILPCRSDAKAHNSQLNLSFKQTRDTFSG